ncbi:hypothetical protein L1049_011882 [Liquidambar formosana]|uniref:Transferrin-like domain-containing protein n=1 Tax=Liquidambar formosana TaxID=63359 RepID=A0AAP0RS53_LIQFO
MIMIVTIAGGMQACYLDSFLIRLFRSSLLLGSVKRDTTQGCLESIKRGEADLVNLEAGLAYAAFLNYSMKAIANEVYCNHAESYDAVAVVNRKVCQYKEGSI